MIVASRIVCVFTVVLWGSGALEAAPTVTYDQRQHGDFNLQVDLDDVAVVLLPAGTEFAQRNAFANKVYKIFGRRNGGGHSRKKQKNCSTTTTAPYTTTAATTTTTTTTTTTEGPEVPYSEVPSSSLASTSQGYEEVVQGHEEDVQGHDEDVQGHEEDAQGHEEIAVQGHEEDAQEYYYEQAESAAAVISIGDKVVTGTDTKDRAGEQGTVSTSGDLIFSVTPAANVPVVAEADHAVVVADPTVVKIAEKAAVLQETVTGRPQPEMVEKSAAASDAPDDLDGGVKADVKPMVDTASTDVEEKPQPSFVSSSSSSEKIDEKTATVAVKAKDENVMTAGEKTNVVEKPGKLQVETTKTAGAENETPADRKSGATEANDGNAEPVEMVVMKTMEKPTFAEALQKVQKPVASGSDVKGGAAAMTQKGASPADRVIVMDSREPTEMIAMKTMVKPAVDDRSGVTASTRPMEVVHGGDKKTSAAGETVVSRSAPKLTEMVAVKTMENPTASSVSTAKSVVSVKTVIKPGTPKTTVLSNGSSIMRKVGDRKPMPSVSLDVAPPRVV